ncbi:hypothetical protein HNY73_019216 [Argiope bruennichi]|uniref:Uncharacterized protein n=1 Tax=Argiope bruennichi TaxID=94029 RepID=A0A8T0EGK6_ARGBR|nr:hypothetical protein HNY73_019216 [Argiope bruennichi]
MTYKIEGYCRGSENRVVKHPFHLWPLLQYIHSLPILKKVPKGKKTSNKQHEKLIYIVVGDNGSYHHRSCTNPVGLPNPQEQRNEEYGPSPHALNPELRQKWRLLAHAVLPEQQILQVLQQGWGSAHSTIHQVEKL